MSISTLIEQIRSTLDDPSFPELAEWKRSHPGGKAIGCFPVYTPVEIIHAAGMLPVLVAGAAGGVKLDRADGYLQSFVCQVARSTLELKLDGFLNELDGMIFPSVCDISRGLSGVWERHETEKPVIYIHFPQNTHSAYALDYLVGELNRVKAILEKIAGSEITADAMLNSFAVYNRRLELLEELDKFRYEHPERLKASEFYILRLAGMTITPQKHIDILENALAQLDRTEAHYTPKLRMVMIGAFCERPPVAMLETIENEGLAIIADDMLLGQRWWRKPLPTTGDPIRNLAGYYLGEAIHSSIVFRPINALCEHCFKIIEERRADGVIISSSKSCQPALHDHFCIIKECEEHGVPYIKLQFEEEQRVFESTRMQVEALIEARERLPFAGTENGIGTANQG